MIRVEYVAVAARCLIGLVFVVAAGSKLQSRTAWHEFVMSVSSLRLVSDRTARSVAVVVVIGEVVTVVLMAAPTALVIAGFMIAAALLVVFAIAITVGRRRGARVRCRCFGASQSVLGGAHVGRDAALAAVALLAAYGLIAESPSEMHPAGVVIAATGGSVAALVAIAMDDVIALFRSSPRSGTTAPRNRRLR